jgi:hypothetical protein
MKTSNCEWMRRQEMPFEVGKRLLSTLLSIAGWDCPSSWNNVVGNVKA